MSIITVYTDPENRHYFKHNGVFRGGLSASLVHDETEQSVVENLFKWGCNTLVVNNFELPSLTYTGRKYYSKGVKHETFNV